MATDVPQRALRNDTAALLRRVEAGERLRVTVHGHPVAELVPLQQPARFVSHASLDELRGLLDPEDRLDSELRSGNDLATDPFA